MENSRSTSSPPIAILGVPFDNVTTAETVDLIGEMIATRRPHYLVTANVDFLVQALHDVELRRILMDAHMVLCDGTPLVWASRLLGNPLPERVAGSDLVPLLIRVAAEKKHRLFFLGGTPEATGKAVTKLRSQFPELCICGFYSPPFSRLMDMDHQEILRRIEETRPDILFVSFGCPKQEKWIAMHYRAMGVPVAVGVGATIDFLAGTARRAPKFMQRTGTEWIFRMVQEPRRLCKRYFNDLWWFSQAIVRQWWAMQFSPRPKPNPSPAAPIVQEKSWKRIRMPERLDVTSVRQDGSRFEEALAASRYCLLELRTVKFIDSTGMGLLIRLQKRARNTGRKLILLSPSPEVVSALKLMKLSDFFITARDFSAAIHLMQEDDQQPHSAELQQKDSPAETSLLWRGELTAANAEKVWESTHQHIMAKSDHHPAKLCIDITGLQFIDSTGLGVMLRTKKKALQQGMSIVFTGIQPNVRNVLKLAKLEGFLLGEPK